jgi:hypothetical protein
MYKGNIHEPLVRSVVPIVYQECMRDCCQIQRPLTNRKHVRFGSQADIKIDEQNVA